MAAHEVVDKTEKAFYSTFSFALCVAAGAAFGTHRRKLAGWLLLLCSAGYLGVICERWCNDDLRRIQRVWSMREPSSASQLAAHAAIGYVGWRFLDARRGLRLPPGP